MGYFTGTSTNGEVSYPPQTADEESTLYLWFPGTTFRKPVRVGYMYIFEVTDLAQGKQFLLWRGAIYFPGQVVGFNNGNSFLNDSLRILIRWDSSNLPFEVYY